MQKSNTDCAIHIVCIFGLMGEVFSQTHLKRNSKTPLPFNFEQTFFICISMKYLLTALASILIFSCNSKQDKVDTYSLKEWVLDKHNLLEKDIEGIIKNDLSNNKRDSNWLLPVIATTMYAPNSLGKLATIAGDSSDCVIVELTFFRDEKRKRQIMIVAEDSSCLNK